MDINTFLQGMNNQKASDLYITVGAPVLYRVDGELRAHGEKLSLSDVDSLLGTMMDQERHNEFMQSKEANFAIVRDFGRYRISAFYQRELPGAVVRRIETTIPTFDDLRLPDVLQNLSIAKRGLVLVVGATGSGKSTTMAAMTGYRNANRTGHILTIEDPIEFVHTNNKCLVNQREVHRDTHSFKAALRSALREDPDVILVGELRDQETISLALTAAETGHLVFGTLHTSSAAKTIDRIIDVFPGSDKDMVRSMLSESLRSVIAQKLLKRIGGGRVACHEIMMATPAIRNLIREDKVAQMYSIIQTGAAHGMQTMEQNSKQLIAQGVVDPEEVQKKIEIESSPF